MANNTALYDYNATNNLTEQYCPIYVHRIGHKGSILSTSDHQ